jgi:hypothetical protein
VSGGKSKLRSFGDDSNRRTSGGARPLAREAYAAGWEDALEAAQSDYCNLSAEASFFEFWWEEAAPRHEGMDDLHSRDAGQETEVADAGADARSARIPGLE